MMLYDGLDRRSFILGMVTAFSECVAGGCKRLALSPPLSRDDYRTIAAEAEFVMVLRSTGSI